MKCHNCGSEIPDESVFCGMCGAKQTDEVKGGEPEEAAPETAENAETEEPALDAAAEMSEPEEETRDSEGAESARENGGEDARIHGASVGGFELRHCRNCGAALVDGAKFCSNCGEKVTYEYETDSMPARKSKLPLIIAVVAAIIVICAGVFVLGCHDIEGEWKVENGGGLLDMFSESYLEFDDDGTAVYYNGFFSANRYRYTYNRFTKVLALESFGRGDEENSLLHVKWVNEHEFIIPELDMRLVRTDDIPYYDGEYDDDDKVSY